MVIIMSNKPGAFVAPVHTAIPRKRICGDNKEADQHADKADRSSTVLNSDEGWWGYPGPAPYKPGDPIRIIVHTFAAWGEGQEAYFSYLAEGMSEVHPVEWLFLVPNPSNIRLHGNIGKELCKWGEVRVIKQESNLMFYDVLRAVMDFRPHVGHTNSCQGAYLLERCGIPTVYTIDGIERISAPPPSKHAHKIIFQSPQAGEGTVVLNGISQLWPSRRRKGVVLYVGRLDKDKNPELLLATLKLIEHGEIEVVGDSLRDSYNFQEKLEEAGIAEKVKWYGQLPMSEAKRLAASADVILHPSREGFGLALAEAVAGGAIAVTIDEPGYQATMARLGGGYICEPNPRCLANAVHSALLENRTEEERRRYAENFMSVHSCTDQAQKMLEHYKEVMLPTVDIIVLAHGQAELTKHCLLSILSNTWCPYRLIMVDNGSPNDDVMNVFKHIADLHEDSIIIRSKKNLGCAGGRRKALKQAVNADFVVTIDNDMLVSPGWLGKLLRVMWDNKDVGAVGAWWSAYICPAPRRGPFEKVFGCAAALLRREAIPKNAYTAVDKQVANDTELLWEMIENGWKLMVHPEAYWFHIGGPPQMLGMTRRNTTTEERRIEEFNEFKSRWVAPGIRNKKDDAR